MITHVKIRKSRTRDRSWQEARGGGVDASVREGRAQGEVSPRAAVNTYRRCNRSSSCATHMTLAGSGSSFLAAGSTASASAAATGAAAGAAAGALAGAAFSGIGTGVGAVAGFSAGFLLRTRAASPTRAVTASTGTSSTSLLGGGGEFLPSEAPDGRGRGRGREVGRDRTTFVRLT